MKNKKVTTKKVVSGKKINNKNGVDNDKLLSDKAIAILYLLCAFCWILGGVLNVMADLWYGYFDFGLAAVWIILSIVYFNKSKKGN